MLFKMDADITISYVDGVFHTGFDNLELNFFNFMDVAVSGYIESDGDFLIHGSENIHVDWVRFPSMAAWRSPSAIPRPALISTCTERQHWACPTRCPASICLPI